MYCIFFFFNRTKRDVLFLRDMVFCRIGIDTLCRRLHGKFSSQELKSPSVALISSFLDTVNYIPIHFLSPCPKRLSFEKGSFVESLPSPPY